VAWLALEWKAAVADAGSGCLILWVEKGVLDLLGCCCFQSISHAGVSFMREANFQALESLNGPLLLQGGSDVEAPAVVVLLLAAVSVTEPS
jgi:hypothetical protein